MIVEWDGWQWSMVFMGAGHVESGKEYRKSEIPVEDRTRPPATYLKHTTQRTC
jgi:hypothetical protein